MAYAPHALIAFCGGWVNTMPDASKETWQFGIRVTSAPGGGWLTDPQALANSLGPPVRSWYTLTANRMSNQSELRTLKVNNITADGKYKDPITHQYVFSPAAVGAASSTQAGLMSIAYTFRTDRGRLTSGHGRVYPPNATSPLAGGIATISSTETAAHVAAAKALLQLIATAGAVASVVSKKDGTVGVINSVSVDSRVDSQRRRTRQIIGTRSTLAFP